MISHLRELLGREHPLDSLNRALRFFAQSQRPTAVGAMHVSCADECEREAADSFQHWFAEQLLPELKFGRRSPFRIANLGSRYEWGAVRIAEQHFATPATHDSFKLMLIKLNAHVSVVNEGGEWRYGLMNRYDVPSSFCGAINALINGQQQPAVAELREGFASEGKDRLAMLMDNGQVDANLRPLLAAVVNARLQARTTVVDIQDYRPSTPTLYLVLPCVTLNQPQRDTEFVIGAYTADARSEKAVVSYEGLGDDPSQYVVRHRHNLLRIEDEQLQSPRDARDHRESILDHWQQRRSQESIQDSRLDEVVRLATNHNGDSHFTTEMLKTLLWVSLDLSPIPTSILLFGKGLAGVHHLYRVHRLARGSDEQDEAKQILEEMIAKVQTLPAEQTQAAVKTLLQHYRPNALGQQRKL